jgi:hypothetical protein
VRARIIYWRSHTYCEIKLRVGRKCLISLMCLLWAQWCLNVCSWIQVYIIEMNRTPWLFFLLWFWFIRRLEETTTFPSLNLRPWVWAALILLKTCSRANTLSLNHHLPIKYLFISFISKLFIPVMIFSQGLLDYIRMNITNHTIWASLMRLISTILLV